MRSSRSTFLCDLFLFIFQPIGREYFNNVQSWSVSFFHDFLNLWWQWFNKNLFGFSDSCNQCDHGGANSFHSYKFACIGVHLFHDGFRCKINLTCNMDQWYNTQTMGYDPKLCKAVQRDLAYLDYGVIMFFVSYGTCIPIVITDI